MSTERTLSIRMVIGAGITLLGIGLLLDRLDVIDVDRFVRAWPVILLVIGLLLLSNARKSGNWFGGAIVTLLGLFLLGRSTGLIDFGLGELWPLFIILAGIGVLTRGFGRSGRGGGQAPAEDRISQYGILCGLSPKIHSQAFRGGDLNAFMGGVELDLRDAGLSEDEAVLNIFAMMGGISIRVPRDWTVSAHVTPFMGAMEDKTDQSESDPGKRLTIRGFVMMGGAEVLN